MQFFYFIYGKPSTYLKRKLDINAGIQQHLHDGELKDGSKDT